MLILLSGLAFAIPDTLTLQGKLTNLAGAVQTGTFNFTFKVYDSFTDGNVLWQHVNMSVTTDSNGIYDIILQNLSRLNFSEQYYLAIDVEGKGESDPRINLTSSPYSFRANVSENLNRENKYEVSVFNITGNLTLGTDFDDVLTITTGRLNITDGDIKTAGNLTLAEKITFSFGAIIDNLVSNILRISGRLNVTGNVSIAQNTLFVDNTSSRVGIGTTSPINILTVAGDVSAFGSLNATFINATEIRQGVNQVQTINAVFNLANYSTEYAATGFKIANYSAAYEATGFDRENATLYLGEDGNASLLRTVNVSKDLARSFSNFLLANVSNNTLVKGDNATLALWDRGSSTTFLRNTGDSVGIGTTTPDNILTLLGNEITANAILHINATDNYNTSVVNVLTLDHILKSPVNSSGGIGLSMLFRAYDNASQLENLANISAVLYNATNGTELSALTFSTRGNEITDFPQGLVERLRIDGYGRVGINDSTPSGTLDVDTNVADTLVVTSGKVGIGTATPTVQLEVRGGVNISGGLNVTSGNVLLAITSGNVGIGTISPNTKLEVNGTATIGGDVNIPSNNLNVGGGYSAGGVTLVGTGTNRGSGQFGKDILLDGDIISVFDVEVNQSFLPKLDLFSILGNRTQRFLDLFVANIRAGNRTLNITGNVSIARDTIFVDNTSGRVGIGTASPTQLLDVDGNADLGATSGTLYVDSGNARVGIGLTAPNDALEVVGNLRVSGGINATSINATSINVTSLILGWTNLTSFPAACSAGQFATQVGDTLTCSTPAPASGGGWTDDGTVVRLATATDSVGIGTAKADNRLTIVGTDTDSYLDAPSILHLNVTDSQNTTLTNIITLDHLLNNPENATNTKAGVMGGIGLGILFRAINNDSEIINVSFINATLVDARNGTEIGALTFYTANKSGSNSRLVPRLILNGTDVFIAPAGKGNTYINPNGGSVGIGTTSPINILTVVGDVSAFGSLNATFINATEVRQGLNQVQTINAVFNLANYSTEYASTGFKIVNYSDAYASTGFKIANYSAEYASTGFDRENATLYLGEDGNASLLRTVNVSKDLARSFSNFLLANVSNNTLVKGDNATLALWDRGSSTTFLRNTGDNVGIGTTTPDQELHVIGNVTINDSVTEGAILIDSTNNVIFTGENGTLYQPVYGTDDDLVGYWPFSENTINTSNKTYDRSPYGNDGLLVNMNYGNTTDELNNTGWAPGKYGNAIQFDGSNDYVNLGRPSSLQNLRDFSISAWIYPRTVSGVYYIVAQWLPAGVDAGEFIFRVNNGYIDVYLDELSGQLLVVGNITANTWQHVVVTVVANTRMELYINGLSVASTNSIGTTAPYLHSGTDLRIGSHETGGNFNGTIDEVMIYKRALLPEEIRTQYLRGSGFGASGAITADRFRVVNTSGARKLEINQTGFAVHTGGAERLKIDSSGNVGIGTTAPGRLLEVAGSINGTQLNISGPANLAYGSGNVGIGTTTPAQTLTVQGRVNISQNLTVNNSVLFVDGTSGRVGIGTTSIGVGSSSVIFEVDNGFARFGNIVGSAEGGQFMLLNVAGDGDGWSIDADSRQDYRIFDELSNIRFRIKNATGDIVLGEDGGSVSVSQGLNASSINTTKGAYFATTSGNVGVGTTTPDTLLTILGNEVTANAILHINASDNFNVSVINVITLDHILKSAVNSTGGVGLSILFRATDNASQLEDLANISAILYNATNGTELSALTFSTRGADTIDDLSGNLRERLRIDGSGRVGINDTTPSGALDVDTSSADTLVVTSGKVGIGTASPINVLTVAGDVSAFGSLNATFINATEIRQGANQVQTINAVFNLANYSTEYASTGFKRGNVTDYLGEDGNASLLRTVNVSKDLAKSFSNFLLANVSNNTLVKGDNATLALWNRGSSTTFLRNTGDNVGIGTITPAQTLTVQGRVNISQNLTVNNSVLFVDGTSGNVGIGTANPLTKLEVEGSVNISGGLNVTAGDVLLATTSGNVGIGTITPSDPGGFSKVISINGSNSAAITLSSADRTIWQLGKSTTGGLGLYSPDTEYVWYAENVTGNLGIGNTRPGRKLEVSGSINGTQLNISGATNLAYGSGNVGIGTTSPNVKLTVIGGINASGGLNVTAGDVLLATSSGSVGIGTAAPGSKLHVIGNINASGDVKASNFTIVHQNGSLYQPIYPTDDNLIGYWSFSEGTGTTAYDKSPYGNDGTLTCNDVGCSNPSYTKGKYGIGLDVNGLADYANVPWNPIFNLTNFTVSTWVKTVQSDTGHFVTQTDASKFYWVLTHTSGVAELRIMACNSGEEGDAESLTTKINNGEWYYIAASYQNSSGTSTVRMFVNGILEEQSSFATGQPCVGIDAPIKIGDNHQNVVGFNGTIDEVKIWNKVLTAEEIRTQYLSGTQSHGMVLADKFRVVNTSGARTLELNTTAFDVKANSGSSALYVNKATGNVGIGTTDPQAKLSVSASGSGNLDILNITNTDEGAQLKLGYDLSNNILYLNAPVTGAQKISLRTAGSDRLFVDSDGEVGIGTTTPGTKLHVIGVINATAINTSLITFPVGSDTGTASIGIASVDGFDYLELTGPGSGGQRRIKLLNLLYITDTAGNVGIGIANATEKLVVAGNANITGTLYKGTSVYNNPDIAERMPSPEILEEGDVVIVGDDDFKVIKSFAEDQLVVGVNSPNATLKIGGWKGNNSGYDIALVGRVLTKVKDANGMIMRGDKVTSYYDGYAVKCDDCENAFGIAMTEQKKAEDKIVVLLR